MKSFFHLYPFLSITLFVLLLRRTNAYQCHYAYGTSLNLVSCLEAFNQALDPSWALSSQALTFTMQSRPRVAAQFNLDGRFRISLPISGSSSDGNCSFALKFMTLRDRRYAGLGEQTDTTARASIWNVKLAVFEVLAQCVIGDEGRIGGLGGWGSVEPYTGLTVLFWEGNRPPPRRVGGSQGWARQK